ncbi:MAG: hypothetical protein E7037_03580 [Verrucomicrobia bacterium]|nr:hypothetical protein [Verrucomicrobiota bacterium]
MKSPVLIEVFQNQNRIGKLALTRNRVRALAPAYDILPSEGLMDSTRQPSTEKEISKRVM